MISYPPFILWFISYIISPFDSFVLEHFLLRSRYLQVVRLLVSFTVDEMAHFVINEVQKTKTIQVFFKKIAVSGGFHSSLPLITMIRTITNKDHRSYSSEYQKAVLRCLPK